MVPDSKTVLGNRKRMKMMTSRRDVFKAVGALALAGGARNGIAQTSPPRAGRPRTGATTPDYTLLSRAVIDSYGIAAGNVWTGSNRGALKSDDLVRASALLRVTTDHFEEIGMNAYVDLQVSQPPSGTISPTVFHAVGEQLRSYGILLTDAEIENTVLFSPNPNTQQQALNYVTTSGISGIQAQVAASLDLAAKKLRLQEIATACGELLDVLPSSQSSMQAMKANNLTPQASSYCYSLGELTIALGAAGGITAYLIPPTAGYAAPVVVGLLLGGFLSGSVYNYSCT